MVDQGRWSSENTLSSPALSSPEASSFLPSRHFLTITSRVAYEEYFNPEQQGSALDNPQAHISGARDGTEQRLRTDAGRAEAAVTSDE